MPVVGTETKHYIEILIEQKQRKLCHCVTNFVNGNC
jgi:hypothetical protein